MRLLSPLSRNILVINLITLVIPVLGFLYLADYRRELIRTEVKSLSQETQTFADALAEGAVDNFQDQFQLLDITHALQILHRISDHSNMRAIMFLSDGTLVADTRFMHHQVSVDDMPLPQQTFTRLLEAFIDKFHAAFNYLEDRTLLEKYQEPAEIHIRTLPHAIEALSGKIETTVWASQNNRELVISSAAPIQPLHRVFGVLVVTRVSDKVETTIRELRVNILSAFFVAIVFTITMSLLLARQISRPLSRLARAAQAIDEPDMQLNELHIPVLNPAHDEIGILSRALWKMTENLKARITAIEGFAADVAHEIRNPISGISSALETYHIVKSEQKREELLAMAQKELGRIDIMIDDILESSRLDAAIQEEGRDLIDIARWIKQFEMTYHDLNHQRKLQVQAPERAVWVSFRESRLAQIMQNLLSNAFDFQPEGQPIEITISIVDSVVKIVVIDRGPGIPEQSLEKIFERFYSDRPAENQTFHTGLGLSIVKQIVEGYNGTISAANRPPPETGAIFTVILPFIERQNPIYRPDEHDP